MSCSAIWKLSKQNFRRSIQPEPDRWTNWSKTFLSPSAIINISLDRLLADLELNHQPSVPAAPVKNDPPKIFVAYGSAILLLIDGKLVQAPIEKTNLEFVVNTNWDLFFDKSTKKYYLLDGKKWLTATSFDGPWAATTKLPADISKIPDQPNWADVKKAIPPPAGRGGDVPKVFYSSDPAEIITFNGKPVYTKIPNTQLQYATNTESNVFLDGGDNQYYYLVAGRWFRARTLDGPWTFATADLPADFAKIPTDSPNARVLVSVPGTDEAKDAVMLAQIPNTVIVDRAKAEAKSMSTTTVSRNSSRSNQPRCPMPRIPRTRSSKSATCTTCVSRACGLCPPRQTVRGRLPTRFPRKFTRFLQLTGLQHHLRHADHHFKR